MARRNDHSRDEIKQLALNAAIAIITKQGLDALSARKIAKAIHYSVGSLYLVFENLDDLLYQIHSLTLDELYYALLAIKKEQLSPSEQIYQLTHCYWQFVIDNKERWLAIFDHHPTSPIIPPSHQQKTTRLFRILEAPLEAFLIDNTPERVNQASRILWANVHGIFILAIRDKFKVVNSDSAKDSIDFYLKMYLTGLNHPS